MDRSALRLAPAQIEYMQSFFKPLPYESLPAVEPPSAADAAYQAWYRYNTRPHKVPGYRVVFVSLKARGQAPGDATSEQMEHIAALADRYSFGQVRVTYTQNLVLGEVRERDLPELWRWLEASNLATPNIGTLTDMICCPGLEYCSLANASSIPIAHQIWDRFADLDYQYDLGDIDIKMSGCMNACGHHHVGHIGILGVDKSGEEWYQITLGGSASEKAALGDVIGPSVPKAEVAATIERILNVYLEQRTEDERFIDTVWRLGIEPFKERVYAAVGEHRRRRA
jgi:sulfite reductase (NADPH) hemoprotein beta-component